ncbi:hypothetical protein [Modestobacter sp. SYSU DS0657]
MDVRGVDPRDVRWEIDQPRYRVHFWWGAPGDEGRPPGSAADEYEISGADIPAVLDWAAFRCSELGADRFEVFAVVDHAGDRGLVRLTAG